MPWLRQTPVPCGERGALCAPGWCLRQGYFQPERSAGPTAWHGGFLARRDRWRSRQAAQVRAPPCLGRPLVPTPLILPDPVAATVARARSSTPPLGAWSAGLTLPSGIICPAADEARGPFGPLDRKRAGRADPRDPSRDPGRASFSLVPPPPVRRGSCVLWCISASRGWWPCKPERRGHGGQEAVGGLDSLPGDA